MTQGALHGSLDSVVTARAGSRTETLRELYDGCYRRLVGQLFAVTGDLGEAQDAVQEAFVRALAAPRRFGRVDNPEAWLRVVALNVARRRLRRRSQLERLLRRVPPAVSAAPGLSPDHVAVVAALRRLPPAQAEAVALHHLADLPVGEIAELTGVAVGTVKARLSRGRARLAELLADEPDRPAPPAAPPAATPADRAGPAAPAAPTERPAPPAPADRAEPPPAAPEAERAEHQEVPDV